MCGFAGYWGVGSASRRVALAMGSTLKNRGPDDSGVWLNGEGNLAFSHRRLAVIDLSTAGHQPMVSRCGKYSVVFNGEIYNHHELRRMCEGEKESCFWRGHSDTEVLLECLVIWGVELTLSKLNGMFSFAFWNGVEKKLFLARDRFGEKPLYYGSFNGFFLFGSQLKALKIHPEFRGEIDRGSLALYMRHSYIPSPYSIYKDVFKVKPAHYLEISNCGRNISEQRCYWDLREVISNSRSICVNEENEAVNQLHALLRDATRLRMEADVSVGAFLSGGFDSTLITALMQELSIGSVSTFSIGFSEKGYNEAGFAKRIARELGTSHFEFYVSPKDVMDVVPLLPEIYDEPFADASQIPSYILSKLARQHVTVAVSGDGGDELFGGYTRYIQNQKLWQVVSSIPAFLRSGILAGLSRFPGCLARLLIYSLSPSYRSVYFAKRLPRLVDRLNHNDFESFYRHSVSHFKSVDSIVIGADELQTEFDRVKFSVEGLHYSEKMMLIDALTYLPDDILTKIDRVSMAVSLEARVPFLDHRLMEYSWRLPPSFKIRQGRGKWILREILYRYVPRQLMDRPKKGFSVPVKHWLSTTLREWAEDLLCERRLREDGYIDPMMTRQLWDEYLKGDLNNSAYIWDVLMFQAWLRHGGHHDGLSLRSGATL